MLAFLRRRAESLPWPFFVLAAVLFYSIPLFSSKATIHWDLADVTYPAQKFLADSLHAGKLPQWTPYLDSGIPFLADPRTGAWYPLHWLFFALGVTPRAMVWELALHAFIAMAGAYLLSRRLFNAQGPAVLGAVLYGFCGFFAAHSSLLGAFEAAAWLPWLLWGALKALDSTGTRWTAFTALMGALIVLAGQYAIALESLAALVCVVISVVIPTRKWARGAALIASVAILSVMAAAVQVLPALTLYTQSHPAASSARFHFGALGTLVSADYYTLISGLYSGPDDPRQFYFYGGLLLVPLAISGFARREQWPLLLAMIAPAVLFDAGMFGANLRPPGDAWLPAALGLAMAASSGAIWIETRMARPYIWAVLLALSLIDLWFWNLHRNPLVFARAAFTEVYGKPAAGAQPVAGAQPRPMARTWAAYPPLGLGPADAPLITRTEAAYGVGLGELDRYTAYLAAADKNPKLLNGLGVTDLLFGRGRVVDNPNSLGRVSVPPKVEFVASRDAALSALAKLDPAQAAVVEAPSRPVTQGVESASVTAMMEDSLDIKYSASGDSLLRVAIPYYPGWQATVDGEPAALAPVDEALTGVFVPAGEHALILRFDPPRFSLGVSLSVAAVIALVIGLILA